MLKVVIEEDKNSFRTNNEWLNIPLSDSLFFSELEYLWNNELKIVYENDFIHIVYDGKLPDEDKVLKSLNLIKDRLIKIV